MLELLRYISHIPFLIPHAVMRDTVLGGYAIPKDTQVPYPIQCLCLKLKTGIVFQD